MERLDRIFHGDHRHLFYFITCVILINIVSIIYSVIRRKPILVQNWKQFFITIVLAAIIIFIIFQTI
ncbi:hypothetical protein COJ46_01375 [Bacillus sp. AFS077874]|nr:hypothetical protein CON00_04150 [Bacillus sp. AFS096315]PFM83198.1 hypothetical protein COJ46_01375 [Bacillus sp. AFS077874]